MGKFDRIKKLKIGSYLRELSVVVIGVAITFFISDLINRSQEKKDLQLQLNAIYAETENNLEWLNQFIKFHEEHNKLKSFLLDNFLNPQPHLQDSIRKYKTAYTHTTSFIYKKSAYNMFVNSGAMKMLTDRKLLLNITDIYMILEELSHQNNEFSDAKREVFYDIYKLDTKDALTPDILSPKMQSTYNFHALYNGLDSDARQVKKQMEELLSNRK